MPYRKISPDVKYAALRLYQRELLPLQDILQCLRLSRRTFFRIQKLFHQTGDVIPPCPTFRGRPRSLNLEDCQYLIELIRHRPNWFLDELTSLMVRNRFISVHYTTIHRELSRANISLKKLRKVASERNEDLRADFMRQVAQYTADQLVFIDETSKDERTAFRRYGRAAKGQRACMRGVFVRGSRLSAVAAMSCEGIIAGHIVEGSVYRDEFLTFLEHAVLAQCEPYSGKHSVLIMDNARIHHGEQINEIAVRYGVRLVFLPPYSPDLNPIEEAFSKIKTWIRRNADVFAAANSQAIFYDLYEALFIVTAEDACSYIQHSGYM